jgi:hypothetical protein
MSIGLTRFLIEAGHNPSLVHSLRREPERFGTRHGLSRTETAALLSGDQKRLQLSLDYLPLILQITYPPPDPPPEPEPDPATVF